MSNKLQRKLNLNELWNPHILTLDQALRLSEEPADNTETKRHNMGRSVNAIRNRVTCRFTGPSNIHQLTYGERMVWDLTYMQGEVLNGGFHQYLTNSTGETSEDVKQYLHDIGAVQTSKLFKRLSTIFPNGKVPRDQSQRCALIEEWEKLSPGNDLIGKLSACFYRQRESLDTLIVAYVRKHQADFVEPSDAVVLKLKRKDKIKIVYCGHAEPEWMQGAEEALKMLTAVVTAKQAKRGAEKKSGIKSAKKSKKTIPPGHTEAG